MSQIVIRGAREHNLNNVDLTLPGSRLICFSGVSGSGKSSLAFDTLYAEGQRRYVETLSSYARQFLNQAPKPSVDQITGLSPSISISQKTAGSNSRSTVGTVTEISDYLRLLYARVGTGYCPKCGDKISAQSRSQILERLLLIPDGSVVTILAPITRNQRGRSVEVFASLRRKGYRRVRIDGRMASVDEELALDRNARHSIDVVVDRFVRCDGSYSKLTSALDAALQIGKGRVVALVEHDGGNDDFSALAEEFAASEFGVDGNSQTASCDELYFSSDYACSKCGLSFERPTPRMFSFNNSQGMCGACQGMGWVHTFDPALFIPDTTKSFQQGCILPIGKWSELGEMARAVYVGAARKIAETYSLDPEAILETAWEELDPRAKERLLWGIDEKITCVLQRDSKSTKGVEPFRWKRDFPGVIPCMLKEYETSTNRPRLEKMETFMRDMTCPQCGGSRLNAQARSVRIDTRSTARRFADKKSYSISELCDLTIPHVLAFFDELDLSPSGALISREIVKEIRTRLQFLLDVGLDYLSLGRSAPTLSGGEMQRIRLAGQLGGGLVGALYVLDEPSIGLHPRDNDRLIDTLKRLRDLGNTVVVVEHDEDTMLASDYLVDFGPGPGVRGGRVVASGSVPDVVTKQRRDSLTAQYIAGDETIPVPTQRRAFDGRELVIRGARHNNLKNIDVHIPLGGIVCFTGVSGSGKSSIVDEILRVALANALNGATGIPGEHDSIEGVQYLKKLISIDQSPIGRTPRSNPATYVKLFDDIRKLYSETPDARATGFTPGRFSFNVPGGRCENCQGNGAVKVEMDFLPDVWTTCPVCNGRRFNQETTAIKYKGLSIDQTLDLDVETALKRFENIPKIREKLQTLYDVGLGYMKLGQPSPTLSGGEAQRIKLAKELVKKSDGRSLYVLDEPTTGLHFADTKLLLNVLQSFADAGNTVVIVEHNLDVVKMADWIIDVGPEGGENGGRIVAEGRPEDVAENPNSHTGRSLKEYLSRDRALLVKKLADQVVEDDSETPADLAAESPIMIRGAREHNLQNVSVDVPRNQLTVCCGPSGSGKSSFAIDVAYSEGRRRYIESLSNYARQFLGQMNKPDVDQVIGVPPSIAITQKTSNRSSHSTVGTSTEILDFLRVLFARLGVQYCPTCNIPVGARSIDEIVGSVLLLGNEKDCSLMILAPISIDRNDANDNPWERLRMQGFTRARINGESFMLDEAPEWDPLRAINPEVVVDRLVVRRYADPKQIGEQRSRVSSSVATALEWGAGEIRVVIRDDKRPEKDWETIVMSQHFSCEKCGRAFQKLSPLHFSFNSPLGRCPACEGRGVQWGSSLKSVVVDPKLSLAEGALSQWQDFDSPDAVAALRALSRGLQVPLDTPFERLDGRFRRALLNGSGDRWFDVLERDFEVARTAKTPAERALGSMEYLASDEPGGRVLYSFQYKGLFPAIDEAVKSSPYYRAQFEFQMEESECSCCMGSRIRDDAAAVRFHDMTLDQISRTPLGELARIFAELQPTPLEKTVAGDLIHEILTRLNFLVDVGLEYLTLLRSASTLSGGEAQRIRLASQLGGGLVGALYVLDEPTIGLHPRDNSRLIDAMKKLRDLGNTLLVVEHDQEVIESADNVIDFGPKAGSQGGLIVASGTVEEIKKNEQSVTGPYLSGKASIPIPVNRRIKP